MQAAADGEPAKGLAVLGVRDSDDDTENYLMASTAWVPGPAPLSFLAETLLSGIYWL